MNDLNTTNSILALKNNNIIKNDNGQLPRVIYKRSHTLFIKKALENDKVLEALDEQRKEVFNLEKDLYECLNLKWNEDIITEDIPLIDGINNNYYMHLLRTAHPDPNKENFLLIHGFLSSNLHFLSLLPYLIKRYNVFIPDTIGMGLSARPQITFTDPIQCEEYFISIYYLFIKQLFFEGRFNIKKEFYLCGHSLGGFISSRYLLKYPQGIKKALLLSPAGITDYNIPGTDFFQNSSCCFHCAQVCCPACVWPCRIRVQNVYHCCCCHNFIKKHYGIMQVNIDESELKKNDDGTQFKVDYNKLLQLVRQLTLLTLDYPKDLYRCAYYLFKPPLLLHIFQLKKN